LLVAGGLTAATTAKAFCQRSRKEEIGRHMDAEGQQDVLRLVGAHMAVAFASNLVIVACAVFHPAQASLLPCFWSVCLYIGSVGNI